MHINIQYYLFLSSKKYIYRINCVFQQHTEENLKMLDSNLLPGITGYLFLQRHHPIPTNGKMSSLIGVSAHV